jgi:insulysin
MGSESYPGENEYSQYLASHGGFSNAYTSQENTVYYFDVQNDGFQDGAFSVIVAPLWSHVHIIFGPPKYMR